MHQQLSPESGLQSHLPASSQSLCFQEGSQTPVHCVHNCSGPSWAVCRAFWWSYHKIQKETGLVNFLSFVREGNSSDLNSSYKTCPCNSKYFIFIFLSHDPWSNIPLVTTSMVIIIHVLPYWGFPTDRCIQLLGSHAQPLQQELNHYIKFKTCKPYPWKIFLLYISKLSDVRFGATSSSFNYLQKSDNIADPT